MEVVRGLTIGDGSVTPQKIYLEVDPFKVCFVTLPNGVVLTSSSSSINYNWTGKSGKVLIVVPKILSELYIAQCALAGNLKYYGKANLFADQNPNIKKVYANDVLDYVFISSSNITDVYCKNAKTLWATFSKLTAQSLGNFMLDAIANNRTAAGQLLATGGTNAGATAINSYLVTQGTTLASVLTQLSTWTITLNA